MILLLVPACGVLAYLLNHEHGSWAVDDYAKLAGLWFTLFASCVATAISYNNTTRQNRLSIDLAAQKERFDKEIENTKHHFEKQIAELNASLAARLEETKVRINLRYKAQESLDAVAMIAADRVHDLQTEEPNMAATLLARIEEARDEMRKKRGALLMVPRDYRDAWKRLLQHITYLAGALAKKAQEKPQMDVRAFYCEKNIEDKFTELWLAFEKVATGDSPK